MFAYVGSIQNLKDLKAGIDFSERAPSLEMKDQRGAGVVARYGSPAFSIRQLVDFGAETVD